MKNMSNIKMATEILEAMNFLGIPTENFLTMRIQYGSIQGLYNHMAELLGA